MNDKSLTNHELESMGLRLLNCTNCSSEKVELDMDRDTNEYTITCETCNRQLRDIDFRRAIKRWNDLHYEHLD